MDNFSSILQDTAQNNIKQTLAAIADVILTNPNENLSTKLEKQEKAKSLAKQHLANIDTPQKNRPVKLPTEMSCGKLSVDQVRKIASELCIPIHMVVRADDYEPDSFTYIPNFWHFSKEKIYIKLVEVGAANVGKVDNINYNDKSLFHLDKLPILYNKLNYKPIYTKLNELTTADGYGDLITSSRPSEILLDIETEDSDTRDPSNKDANYMDFFPFLVLAHSSVKYHTRMLENAVVYNDEDQVDWFDTIETFIDMAMRFRLSRTLKLNGFKQLIKSKAPECSYNGADCTLTQLYEKMIKHNEYLTPKEKKVKNMLKFKRFVGQSLTESIETIFKIYKEAMYPNTNVSLDPSHIDYNYACADHMANCLYSLTTPLISKQIIEHNTKVIASGNKINIPNCATAAERLELSLGAPTVTMHLYKTKNAANTSNTAITIKDLDNLAITKLNFTRASPHYPEDEWENVYAIINDRNNRSKLHNTRNMEKLDPTDTIPFTGPEVIQKSGPNDTIVNNSKQINELSKELQNQKDGYSKLLKKFHNTRSNSPSNSSTPSKNKETLPPADLDISGISHIDRSDLPDQSIVDSFDSDGNNVTMIATDSSGRNSKDDSNADSNNKKINVITLKDILKIKDPWAKSQATIDKIRETEKGKFKYEQIFSNNMSEEVYNAMIQTFDLSEQFFNLGAEIFGIIGYPRTPLTYDIKGVKKILVLLETLVNVPLFYQNLFFNCPSLAPVFTLVTPLFNSVYATLNKRWIENGVPVNNFTTSVLNNIVPEGRSLSRGRIADGKYVANPNTVHSNTPAQARSTSRDNHYGRNPNNSSYSRNRSPSVSRYNNNNNRNRDNRSASRNGRRGVSPFISTRPTGNQDDSKQASNNVTPNNTNKLEVRNPFFRENKCYPFICEGDCEGKKCKKCGFNHPSHHCGFYHHFSPVPCSRCPGLFHNELECQNQAKIFPEPSKNSNPV